MSIPELGLPIGVDPRAASLALLLKSDQRLARLFAELSLGEVISGEVIESDGDGALLLKIRGETVQAKSALELKPGSTLTLRLLSTAPEPTLQLLSYQPVELPLTSLASLALSSPGGLAPLLEQLDAITQALRSLLSSEGEALVPQTAQADSSDEGAAAKPVVQSNVSEPAKPAPTESPLSEALLHEERPSSPTQAARPLAPSLTPSAGEPEEIQNLSRSPERPLGAPTTRAPQAVPVRHLETTAQANTPRPIEPSLLSIEAWKPAVNLTEAGRVLERLETALARSLLDSQSLTPEAVREAIASQGKPIEHALRGAALDPQTELSLSEIVETDLKSALVRTLQSPLADRLPETLKQLVAQTAGQVEGRQALNVMAMAHGQLLFEVALRTPHGCDRIEILVEKDGGGGAGENEAGESTTQVTLQLTPDGLGPLRVLTRLSGDEVSCYLACADSRVADFVEARLPKLRAGLEHQGLQVKALQAVVVPESPDAFAPLRPSRLLSKPLLDARV
jgi:flagellar hook-length control protein FliK